jgi:hypothetical protein
MIQDTPPGWHGVVKGKGRKLLTSLDVLSPHSAPSSLVEKVSSTRYMVSGIIHISFCHFKKCTHSSVNYISTGSTAYVFNSFANWSNRTAKPNKNS